MPESAAITERLLLKRDLLRRGDTAHESIKTGLLIGQGGMRGAYGGGVIIALRQLGLQDAFDFVIGVSAGAALCAYFQSGQPAFGTSLYYEELSGNRFINPYRLNRIMDIDYFIHTMNNDKPLDVAQIRSSRSKFLIGVTNTDTGRCEYLDADDPSIDIPRAIAASCALPVIYNRKVTINGKEYADGAIACGTPVDYMVNELECTDVLVVLNSRFVDVKRPVKRLERLVVEAACQSYSREFRAAVGARNSLYNEASAIIRKQGGNTVDAQFGVISPENLRSTRLTRDSALLRATVEQGAKDTMNFFGIDEPVDIAPAQDEVRSVTQGLT